ncbi:MAG: branched-chain amino acid ABC transporter substrate-binding protein [Bradymonadales bacterium]|nr:branched-chain amino acid ABC transporter substrate-binding protein [Bradymonadales bacterium]
MKRVTARVLCFLMVGLVFTGCGDEEETVPAACTQAGACAVFTADAPIRIGLAAPLSGDIELYGTDVSRAIQIAIADAGAFLGHSFQMDAKDDLGSEEGATTAANAFVADPTIVAVVGPMFSGAANAAAPIFSEANIPMVSPSATRIDLTQQGYTAFNRVIASDLFQGDTIANYLYQELEVRDLAIIHDQSSFGQALAERVQDLFEELGGDVVAFETLTTSETDYSDVLDTVADESPDSLFFGGYSPEAGVLLTQVDDAGLGDIPFVSDDGCYGAALITAAGADAEGFTVTSASTPPDSTAKAAFDAAYLAAFGEPAGSLDNYCWYGYDAANILFAAIRAVAIESGGSLYIPRAELVARVRATSGYQGITGTITCDATGECSQGGFALYQVQDGAWIKLP